MNEQTKIKDKAIIYVHGKGGNADEATHYKPLFKKLRGYRVRL